MGIVFDKALTFDPHINEIISKANKMLGFIRRSFRFLDKVTFVTLYKAFVRSHLEYGDVLWCLYLKRQSVTLEKVQRKATKLIPSLRNLPYGKRLRELDLPTLKYRRLRGDLIYMYKIFNNLVDTESNMLTVVPYNRTRNCTQKLYVQYSRTNTRRSFL